MTTIENIYFSDEKYSIDDILKELFKKQKIKKVDIIDIIQKW